jgi:hypothetical protein
VITSGLTLAVAVLNAAVMLLLPARLGHLLLGASWHYAKPLLLPAGVQIVCFAVGSGPMAALLGLRALGRTMALNIATTGVLLVGGLGGSLWDGARGALWMIAAGTGILALATWLTFVAYMRHGGRAAQAYTPEPDQQVLATRA